MPDEKAVSKPKQLWDQALRAVKGDDTKELVEQFTQEMTLVAEGLCEDQARLRKAVEDVAQRQQSGGEKGQQAIEALENHLNARLDELDDRLDELEKSSDKRLKDLARRLDALEAQKQKKSSRAGAADWLSRATVLAAIVCGSWVVTTLLRVLGGLG